MTVFYFAPENFLASMILGGVFDRHPRLRFGVIECGAGWIGPLMERMELFVDMFAETRKLKRRPHEYLNDHVRVTPFVGEPVRQHFERYPQLSNVYCFSTDYPHVEGGQHAKQTFYEEIEPLGDEIIQKFFRSNAELLLRDA
jgi:predicted TIM-barrel fold metal-dependent hydrolase